LRLGTINLVLEGKREAQRLFQRSLALFRSVDDRRQTAYASLNLGYATMLQGQLRHAEEMARQIIASDQDIGDRILSAQARLVLADTLRLSGEFAEAEAVLEESLATFDDLGDCTLRAYAHTLLGLLAVHLGNWERARSRASAGLDLAQGVAYSEGIALALGLLCCLALAEGERGVNESLPGILPPVEESAHLFAEARRLAHESVDIVRDMSCRSGLSIYLSLLGAAERRLGRPTQAEQHIREALEISVQNGALELPLFIVPVVAALFGDRGESELAVELYTMAARYPLVGRSRWFELVFGRYIAAAAAALPPGVEAAARERGRCLDLTRTLAKMLDEFDGAVDR
jgi:tetratricopeptide (TPR) repeat protein